MLSDDTQQGTKGGTTVTGYELHTLRDQARMSRAELARRLGVTDATLARWESAEGQHIPPEAADAVKKHTDAYYAEQHGVG